MLLLLWGMALAGGTSCEVTSDQRQHHHRLLPLKGKGCWPPGRAVRPLHSALLLWLLIKRKGCARGHPLQKS